MTRLTPYLAIAAAYGFAASSVAAWGQDGQKQQVFLPPSIVGDDFTPVLPAIGQEHEFVRYLAGK